MKFDDKVNAKGYLESIGQDIYGSIVDGFDEMELSTITKFSLFEIESNPGVAVTPDKIQKEIVHKMVREGVYWQYYIKRGTKWMRV